MDSKMQLFELSLGEWRKLKRIRAEMNQQEMADHLETTRHKVSEAEQSQTRRGQLLVHPHEKMMLLRTRAGLTQRELAQKMGCSRGWVNQLERGHGDPKEALLILDPKTYFDRTVREFQKCKQIRRRQLSSSSGGGPVALGP